MKQKLIIGLAAAGILIVVGLMLADMFRQKEPMTNPYDFSLDEYKDHAAESFCYKEVERRTFPMDQAAGIALDQKGNIYLCGLNKVMIVDPNWKLVNEFEVDGAVKNIHVMNDGQILLAMEDHIELWTADGKDKQIFEQALDKSVYTSICSDSDKIYAADAGNKQISVFDYDGNYLKGMGARDKETGRKGFIIPSPYFDLAIGREGQLWAVNSGMHSLEAFNREGQLISSWKKTSMGPDGFSGCCNPSHFAMLSNGSFVTSEKGLVRVKIHNPDGSFHCMVAGPDDFEEDDVGLDLAVSEKDDIYLLVPASKEIRKYIPVD
jgi:hypothetical protein